MTFPSATTLVTAALLLGAAVFARCGHSPASDAPKPVVPAAQPAAPPSAAEAAPARVASTPSATPSKKRYLVAAIGDSLTDSRSNGGKYLDYLGKRCPESRFDNYGVGGDMVNQMRRRFDRDLPVKQSAYTHLLVFGGVNDLYSDLTAGRTPELIGADLTAIYSAAKSRGWKVIALTVAPWGGFTKYYNASRGAATRTLNEWIVAQRGSTVDFVIETGPLLSCGDPELLCPAAHAPFKDGLHFGPVGHEKIGKALFDTVFSDCR